MASRRAAVPTSAPLPDRPATPLAGLVRTWDHRAEPELVAAWRKLWHGSTQEALDGARAARLSELLRGLVLVSGDAGADSSGSDLRDDFSARANGAA